MERRKVDEEEKALQQVLKENELQKANHKIFQNDERVRALNSQLLFSDALQGREEQIELKKYMKDLEHKRDQFYHEETLVLLYLM